MKYAPGTWEREWLLSHSGPLAEWSNWGDRRWGLAVSRDGSARGRNALGRILTLIRQDIEKGREPVAPEEAGWGDFQKELCRRLEDADLLSGMASTLGGEVVGRRSTKETLQLPF